MKNTIITITIFGLSAILLSGFHELPDQPTQKGPSYSFKVSTPTSTTFYDPMYDGLELGWNGVTHNIYYVADCWCIEIDYDNYQTATITSPNRNGGYWTYDPTGDEATGEYVPYLKIQCIYN